MKHFEILCNISFEFFSYLSKTSPWLIKAQSNPISSELLPNPDSGLPLLTVMTLSLTWLNLNEIVAAQFCYNWLSSELHVIELVKQAWQELGKVVCVCLAISMIRSKSLVLHTCFKLYDGGQFQLLNLGLQFISLFIVCIVWQYWSCFLAVDNFISNTFIVLLKLLPSEC